MKTRTLILSLVVFAGCGLSTGETGTDERSGGESGLSAAAAPSSTTPCPRGQAFCAFTNSCYPEACLSCCFAPRCGKGEAYCASTNRCYPEACLSCCLLGGPSTSTEPDPNTDPAVCDERACGPAPALPTYLCADGSVGGFTGRCLPRETGSCGWEIRSCPSTDDDAR